jgi:hypothetical protein
MTKKILLVSLFVLLATLLKAQLPTQPPTQRIGAPTTGASVPGAFYVDSAMYPPIRDTTWTPTRFGALTIRPQDLRPYMFIDTVGRKWIGLYFASSPCLDSLQTINLVIGTDIPSGSNQYIASELIGKTIKVWREGELQAEAGTPSIFYSNLSGAILFTPLLNFGERLRIDYVCDPTYALVAGNSILSQTGQGLLTEGGVPIIIN